MIKKILVAGAVLVCIFSILSITIIPSLVETKNGLIKSEPPKIYGCFDTVYGDGDKVEYGYATLRYDYLLKNTEDEKVKFKINWGDGASTTTDYVSDYIYVPHIYENSGIYSVIVKCSNEKQCSDPFEIEMVDFYDISVEKVYVKPSNFRPRQKINLCVDVENIGTTPTVESVNVVVHNVINSNKKQVISQTEVGIINPGSMETVEIPLKWFNDKNQHTIFIQVEELNGERTSVNNIEYGYFTAQGLISTSICSIKSAINGFFDRFPRCFTLLRQIFDFQE